MTTVLILVGTNDIGFGVTNGGVITSGLDDLADRAHSAGLRVIVGTLLPRHGAWGPTQTDSGVADPERDTVNASIRTDPHFDAVVDFDSLMGQPGNPEALNPAYSVDRTHPNLTGRQVMANAVDLASLLPTHPPTTAQIVWSHNDVTKCVDRDVAGGHAQIWDCLGGANQLWTLNPDGSLTTGSMCLEEPPGQTANHTLIDVGYCTGTVNQQWGIGADQSLVNAESSRCLDLADGDSTNGRQLQVYDCVGGPNQQWTGAA